MQIASLFAILDKHPEATRCQWSDSGKALEHEVNLARANASSIHDVAQGLGHLQALPLPDASISIGDILCNQSRIKMLVDRIDKQDREVGILSSKSAILLETWYTETIRPTNQRLLQTENTLKLLNRQVSRIGHRHQQ